MILLFKNYTLLVFETPTKMPKYSVDPPDAAQ